jgi:hypothetical protein
MSVLENYKIIEHKTAYALKGNKLVHISEVARGLICNCVCVVCGGQLIARKGEVRVQHFAHAADTDCFGVAETVLHLLAKELFKELNSIVLPQYKFEREKVLMRTNTLVQHKEVVAKGGQAHISKVFIEQSEGRFTPDVTIESNSKRLLVEIAVTHKVDKIKLRHIRKKGLPTIEIQLRLADAILSRDELRDKLEKDINSKCWLYHPDQRKEEFIFINKVRTAIRNSRRPAIKPQQSIPTKRNLSGNNWVKSEGFSNAQMDRMRYEFFLRFKRQPNDEEASKLHSILYGNRLVKLSNEQSYASIKNGE